MHFDKDRVAPAPFDSVSPRASAVACRNEALAGTSISKYEALDAAFLDRFK